MFSNSSCQMIVGRWKIHDHDVGRTPGAGGGTVAVAAGDRLGTAVAAGDGLGTAVAAGDRLGTLVVAAGGDVGTVALGIAIGGIFPGSQTTAPTRSPPKYAIACPVARSDNPAKSASESSAPRNHAARPFTCRARAAVNHTGKATARNIGLLSAAGTSAAPETAIASRLAGKSVVRSRSVAVRSAPSRGRKPRKRQSATQAMLKTSGCSQKT